ncbi:MAG TPA: TonB-dependent receptor [Caulobacteraceae bacterium]|jgi:outer membrane receptor protein involved in Fe transport
MSTRAVDVLCLLSSAAVIGLFATTSALAQSEKTFNIPPKSLAAALNEFAAQSREPILATDDLVAGKTSPGASGVTDPSTALGKLLEGTGLTWRRSGRTFLIVKAPPAAAALPITRIATQQVAAPAPSTPAPLQVAQLDQPAALGEVVVTATRQSSTVNKVALSVTAVTQKGLDQQGVKTIQDFARATPSVVFTRSGSENNPNITIRGIGATLGAPTTGVYLDDTPVQKRGTNGAVTGNGSPTPEIFDLDRVEVLRGPQGTLFGSGSEGGTVRFITPAPSLTKYSTYMRAEASTTQDGSPSYEAGAALGGPLVQDKLGFRASIWSRHVGGYLDHVNIYDGTSIGKDTNAGRIFVGRLAVTWEPIPDLKITPAFYYGMDHADDTDTFYENIPKFSTNGGTFTNKVRIGPPASGQAPDNNGFYYQFPTATIPSYSFGPYNFFGPYKTGVGLYYNNNCGACTAYAPFGPSQVQIGATTVNGVTYPARTINIPGQQPGPNKADLAEDPRTNSLQIPSLDIEYHFPVGITVKSITSYAMDDSSGDVGGQFGARASFAPTSTTSAASIGGQFVIPGTTTNVPGGTGGTGGGNAFIIMPGTPYQFSDFNYYNKANRFVQELRFSSDTAGKRFTWVAGAYFMTSRQDQQLFQPATEAITSYQLRGIDEAFTLNSLNTNLTNTIPIAFNCNSTPNAGTAAPTAVYNCVEPTQPTYTGNSVIIRRVRIDEREIAGFGEGNYTVIDNVKLTLGLRVAEIYNAYIQSLQGSVYGDPFPDQGFTATPAHPFAVPGDVMSTITSGSQTEHPVTPHAAISWQATPDYLLYFSAAEGYRAGGVNAPASLGNCAAQLAALGTTQTPLAYNSDKVWSYEFGAKLRLFDGHAQINSSAFYIDWQNPQLTISLTCGSSYVTNAGAAASKGFDVQSQFRWGGLTVSPSISYTDAEYTQDVPVPGAATFIVKKGMFLPTPKWQAAIVAQYDFRILDKYSAYLRGDFEYQSDYVRTNVGQAGYDPITAIGSQTHIANARLGMSRDGYEANIFVNNLADSQELLNVGHGAGSALITATTFRPREVGVQLIYRY